jgi:hypothetical protein
MGANAATRGLFDISAFFGGGGLIAIILEFLTKLARAGQVELRSRHSIAIGIVADQARHAL